MGLELHALNLVRLLAKRQRLGAVATLGRQVLDLPPGEMAALGLGPEQRFCEPLLMGMGADLVESFDVSPYEGATHIADFNAAVAVPRTYDTVLDFGTLEHIFDQARAFANVRALMRPGGLVGHVLPVNNLAGHGFWQYSADLLHGVYAPAAGFAWTRVFLASALDPRWWYEAPPPGAGTRTDIASVEPVIAIVAAKLGGEGAEAAPQQAYYGEAWADEAAHGAPMVTGRAGTVRRLAQRARWGLPGVYGPVRNAVHVARLAAGRTPLGLGSGGLRKVRVRELVT